MDTFTWVISDIHKLIAAAYITAAVLMIMLGSVVLYTTFIKNHIIQEITDFRIIITGFVLQSFGTSLHLLYLGLVRLFQNTQYDHIITTSTGFELLPLTLLITGSILIVSPLWHTIQPEIIRSNMAFKRKQYIITATMAFGIFWFIYLKLLFTKI